MNIENWDQSWAQGKSFGIQQKEQEFQALLRLLPDDPTIIEIGCYSGGVTVVFSEYASRLVSMDAVLRFNVDAMQKLSEENGCLFDMIVADSHDLATKNLLTLAMCGSKADFLFIDGDHSEHGCYQDYEMYKDFVKKGGLIGFHDIVDSQEHHNLGCYVDVAWQRIKKQHVEFHEFVFQPELGNWAGIGVVRV